MSVARGNGNETAMEFLEHTALCHVVGFSIDEVDEEEEEEEEEAKQEREEGNAAAKESEEGVEEEEEGHGMEGHGDAGYAIRGARAAHGERPFGCRLG